MEVRTSVLYLMWYTRGSSWKKVCHGPCNRLLNGHECVKILLAFTNAKDVAVMRMQDKQSLGKSSCCEGGWESLYLRKGKQLE